MQDAGGAPGAQGIHELMWMTPIFRIDLDDQPVCGIEDSSRKPEAVGQLLHEWPKNLLPGQCPQERCDKHGTQPHYRDFRAPDSTTNSAMGANKT